MESSRQYAPTQESDYKYPTGHIQTRDVELLLEFAQRRMTFAPQPAHVRMSAETLYRLCDEYIRMARQGR